jgi:hypothetical protein
MREGFWQLREQQCGSASATLRSSNIHIEHYHGLASCERTCF